MRRQLDGAGWHKKFGKPGDFYHTGTGYTQGQVDALSIPSVQLLLDYERAVAKPLLDYINSLTEQKLDREAPNSQTPRTTQPVHSRLAGVFNNLQHVGQAGYARGIIKGHRWYGR